MATLLVVLIVLVAIVVVAIVGGLMLQGAAFFVVIARLFHGRSSERQQLAQQRMQRDVDIALLHDPDKPKVAKFTSEEFAARAEALAAEYGTEVTVEPPNQRKPTKEEIDDIASRAAQEAIARAKARGDWPS